MGAKGFYPAQEGHIVPLVYPKDITSGATGVEFSMAKYSHACIIILIGVSAAAFTKIILNACDDAAGSNPVAQPFEIYKEETAAGDVLGAKTDVAAAGLTPSANDTIFYVIEIDAASLPDGKPYIQLSLTNGVNSVLASAVAILSGARFAEDQSPTVIT